MADELRKPLRPLPKDERKRRLLALGLDENLIPLNASPEERHAAMSDANPTPSVIVTPEPAQGAILKQPVVAVLTAVAIVAAAALAASESGLLPKWVAPIANGAIALLAAFGIASPGIRKAS